MNTKPGKFASASTLQSTLSIALIFVSAILLASAAVATPTLGNYPDTTLALSTDTTVTPDAAPTDTMSINVSTSTDFKGTLEGDPTTGVVRVTDAHPAGTYTVTVTAFDGGGATATKTFTLTVTTPVTCNPVSFAAATNFAVSRYPSSVAVGDFNGDGKQDVATANFDSNNATILLGDGTGNFETRTDVATGREPTSVAVGDFNRDGDQDLAVANYGSDNVSILLGDGTGSFSAPTNFAVGVVPNSVAVGDFNGDGRQDLATANIYSNDVSILLRDCPAASEITPAGTSCSQFSSGTAETLGSVKYRVNEELIERVAPGGFRYWVSVTAAAGNNTFQITQTITTGNFSTFFTANKNAIRVFDSDCVSLERTTKQNADTVTVRFNAPSAGTYYIGVTFDADSLLGAPAPSSATVHYDFATTGVPDSTSGLDLVKD